MITTRGREMLALAQRATWTKKEILGVRQGGEYGVSRWTETAYISAVKTEKGASWDETEKEQKDETVRERERDEDRTAGSDEAAS